MEAQKTRIAKVILRKKNKVRRFTHVSFKTSYKASIIKQCAAGIRMDVNDRIELGSRKSALTLLGN